MLRELTNAHVLPYLGGFRINMTSGTPIYEAGSDDTSIRADDAPGASSLRHINPFRRLGVWVGCTNNSVAGSYAAFDHNSNISDAQVRIQNTGGTLSDGIIYGMWLGWYGATTDRIREQHVVCPFAAPRFMAGVFSSAGAVLVGAGDFTCTKTATGTYTVTFKRAFAQAPIPAACVAGGATNGVVNVSSVAASQLIINTYDMAAAATDLSFNLFVLGSQSRDNVGRKKQIIMSTQRTPRLEGYRIDYSAGTPSYAIGAADATGNPSDDGTGLYTITYKQAFRRTPVVIANGAGDIACRVVSSSSTAAQIQLVNNANTATDARSQVIVWGSDDPSEY